MVPAPPPVQDIDGAINEMWMRCTNEIVAIDPAAENWKTQVLPLARIKKIMKSEEAVYAELERDRQEQQARANGAAPPTGPNTRFMIAGEAPVLLGKACELLVKELTVRAWRHTERNRRRTLQRQDVHAAVGESEVYDFLIDIVPRITTTTSAQKTFAPPATEGPGVMPPFATTAHAVNGPPTADAGDINDNVTSLQDATARYTHLQHVQEQMQDHYVLMQQRMQGDVPATSQSAGSGLSLGIPQAPGPEVGQPQPPILQGAFTTTSSDASSQNFQQPGMPQWSGLPIPGSMNSAQPSAPAPAPAPGI